MEILSLGQKSGTWMKKVASLGKNQGGAFKLIMRGQSDKFMVNIHEVMIGIMLLELVSNEARRNPHGWEGKNKTNKQKARRAVGKPGILLNVT